MSISPHIPQILLVFTMHWTDVLYLLLKCQFIGLVYILSLLTHPLHVSGKLFIFLKVFELPLASFEYLIVALV